MKYILILSISSFLIIGFSFRESYAYDYTHMECPVVGNTDSMIYHIPGGKFYARMLRKNKRGDNRKCFQSEEEAKKAKYRKSKR